MRILFYIWTACAVYNLLLIYAYVRNGGDPKLAKEAMPGSVLLAPLITLGVLLDIMRGK